MGLFAFPFGTVLAIIGLIFLTFSRYEFEKESGKAGERDREKGNKEGFLIPGTGVPLVGIL